MPPTQRKPDSPSGPAQWPVYAMLLFCMVAVAVTIQHGRAAIAASDLKEQAFVLPLETLSTTLTAISASDQALQLPGQAGLVVSALAPSARTVTVVETQHWVLLSGNFATRTCPLLGDYVKANVNFTPWTAQQITVVETAYRGHAISLQAHVPRFATEPARLAACPGYTFDAARGLLMMGERPVALLAHHQPLLKR